MGTLEFAMITFNLKDQGTTCIYKSIFLNNISDGASLENKKLDDVLDPLIRKHAKDNLVRIYWSVHGKNLGNQDLAGTYISVWQLLKED